MPTVVSGSVTLCCSFLFLPTSVCQGISLITSPFKLTLYVVSMSAQVNYTKYCTHYYPPNDFTPSVLVSKARDQ